MISLMILTVATYILMSTVTASAASASAKREKALAAEAVSNMIERIRACPPRDVFKLFNSDPSDDPYGKGTGHGPYFDIDGLDPQLDARGNPLPLGEILLPGARGMLDESLSQPEFGLPRDLDGSMFIEPGDCKDRYVLLPLIVRARWSGRLGERDFQMATVAVDRPLGEAP
ncbi:MAG: hypothetical protein AAGG01_01150 [Planctomycetota bacterium]